MYRRYVVKAGDTLEGIASRFNVHVADLVRINGLEGIQSLIPGLELIIPPSEKAESDFFTYRVKKGDTLYSIGLKYGVKPEILALINGMTLYAHLFPDQVLLIPKQGVKVYITQSGDTLDKVAKTFNTTVDKILQDNDQIYLLADQMIVIK